MRFRAVGGESSLFGFDAQKAYRKSTKPYEPKTTMLLRFRVVCGYLFLEIPSGGITFGGYE